MRINLLGHVHTIFADFARMAAVELERSYLVTERGLLASLGQCRANGN
jgi:hypothetical protein